MPTNETSSNVFLVIDRSADYRLRKQHKVVASVHATLKGAERHIQGAYGIESDEDPGHWNYEGNFCWSRQLSRDTIQYVSISKHPVKA